MNSVNTGAMSGTSSKYKISRRGRKLQFSDDYKTLASLPKETIPERTWAEVLQKEENDLIVFDIREEIIENALELCYEAYMERQTVAFTVHCAAKAWLKIVDWYFLKHDPGEDPSAYPPCDIPNRLESWTADPMPVPSPKDSWAYEALPVQEECKPVIQKTSSMVSLECPDIPDIPQEYWYPGKIKLAKTESEQLQDEEFNLSLDRVESDKSIRTPDSANMAIESEMLEKVTDYNQSVISTKHSEADLATKPRSRAGGGDKFPCKKSVKKSKPLKKTDLQKENKDEDRSTSRISLLRLESKNRGDMIRPKVSTISDCRLRSLRLDTQYEISSEKVESLDDDKQKKKKK